MAIVCAAPRAWSQTPTATDWRHRTSRAGFVGAATESSDAAMAAGATVGWELIPNLTLEGRGIWLDTGHAADASAGVIGARVSILPARPVVPFVSTGIGSIERPSRPRPGSAPVQACGVPGCHPDAGHWRPGPKAHLDRFVWTMEEVVTLPEEVESPVPVAQAN
jgi:hypothetical protein